ncbi:MAG: hypothetical protein ACFFCS_04840 [Candidatus Hodarchaeota archaeon]
MNEICMGLIFFMCSFTYPFMYIATGLDIFWQQTFFLFSDLILFGFIGFLMYYIIGEYLKAKKNPQLKVQRSYDALLKKANYFEEYTPKMDLNRKLLHIIPVGVILLFYLVGMALDPILSNVAPTPITPLGFAYFFIVTVGYAFVTMFAIEDILRLIDGHRKFYTTPDWAHKWITSSLKKSEIHTFLSSIPMVLCLMPFLFGPFPILLSVALISSFADAAASLIGNRFGKRTLVTNSKKTYEGLIAGGLVTFIVVFLTYFVFEPILKLEPFALFWLSVGTAVVFILIDMFGKTIVDNILNPLICGGFMVLFVNFLIF